MNFKSFLNDKINTKNLILFLAIVILSSSCDYKKTISFTYNEFKETLYYNSSLEQFSDKATLGVCINRWGKPEFVKGLGSLSDDGFRHPHTIVFQWPNLSVDNRPVEIHFEVISGYPNYLVTANIESDMIHEMKNGLKVKSFKLKD